MKLKDLLAPFAVWKRTFEKPYTIKNPIDDRPGSDRYRGFHKNDSEKCIGCGTCVDTMPHGCLSFGRNLRPV